MRPIFAFDPAYSVDIGVHVFPIEKYSLARKRLLDEGDTTPDDWRVPEPATRDQLLLAHTPEYLDDLLNARWSWRTASSEFPLTTGITRAYVASAGGSILAARESLVRGISVNVGGGFHHAFADQAAGFCYVNDIAVAIRTLQHEGLVRRAAVIDCDLHQGNGTARIFQGDDSVFTFSMHQENLYPVKEKSDWDIGLPDRAGDALYLEELRRALPEIFDRAAPELVVYQAGADPYEEDQLGDLGITMKGLAERDRLVLEACAERGVPCAVTFGGGYARRLADTVSIHVNTCRAALAIGARTGAADRFAPPGGR